MHKERREHERVISTGTAEFSAEGSLVPESQRSLPEEKGKVVDLSNKGLCMITSADLSATKIIKVNVPVPGKEVKIPTLAMKVWQAPIGREFKVGLRFVL